MYSCEQVIKLGRLPPCHGYFSVRQFYHKHTRISTPFDSPRFWVVKVNTFLWQHHINIPKKIKNSETPFTRPLLHLIKIKTDLRMSFFVVQLYICYNIFMESTCDRVVISRVYEYRRAGIHKKGGGADDSL